MLLKETIALDRGSSRTLDKFGRLHVVDCVLTKECVSPYLGSEIALDGLEPDKVYYLYRPASELKKAMDSVNNIQLVTTHTDNPITASDHKPDMVIGSTGTDARVEGGKLLASLVVWDASEIALINDEAKKELSCGYSYVPVIKSGSFEGVAYDMVMTDIVYNHVALVVNGRVGKDACIADALPEILNLKQQPKGIIMTKSEKLIALKEAIASDSIDLVALKALALDMEKEESEADDEEEEKAKADDEFPDDDDDDDKKKKDAKDSAIAIDAKIAAAVSKATGDLKALYEAREAVHPLVGKVALDSAEAVYRFALKQAGYETKAHASALPEMFKMAMGKAAKPAVVANDRASHASDTKSLYDRFPQLKAIK